MNRIASIIAMAVLASAANLAAAPPTVQELLAGLKAGDEQARVQAIDRLGALGSRGSDAVAPLAALLADASPAVRAHAARALGAIGKAAKPVVPNLAELLKDSDATVRRQAVRAVMAIRPGPDVAIPLCIRLLEDSDPIVRTRVLHAIAESREQAVPGLIKALDNEKAAYWACLVLREIGPRAKDAVGPLTEKLKDPRPEIRREAALALAAMESAAAGSAAQLAGLLDDEHTRVAATFALGQIGKLPADAEKKIRDNRYSDQTMLSLVSLWALARVHPEDKELRREVTERLVEKLKDPDAFVRAAAARGLAALPPAPEITAPIWEKALLEADETTLRLALDSLAAQGDKLVPRLIDGLKHPKARAGICYVLGQIGPPAAPATKALAELVGDPRPRVARESMIALAKIGPGAAAAVPALTTELDADDDLPYAAAFALGSIGPAAAAAAPQLETKLQSKDAALAVAAGWALRQIKADDPTVAARVLPAFVAGLRSANGKTRQAAAHNLGELGPKAANARADLEKLTNDRDPAVREAVKTALAAIGG